jgi:two-component system alkaline phosphatase synthesis response regulator PhoP
MNSQTLANGVILAENDSQMRELIRYLLSHVGQHVYLAGDGAEAVKLARQFRPRLVLLDRAMPRLIGIQACAAIHSLPGYVDVPIIMLTSHDNERFRTAAKEVGAKDFITKPFRPGLLLKQLSGYLDIPNDPTAAGGMPLPVVPDPKPVYP